MDSSDAIVLIATIVVLLGVFARRIHPSLVKHQRLLIIVGGVGVLLFAGPDFVRGLLDGFRAGTGNPQ